MPFFESASRTKIHGGTFSDHSTRKTTINNNQTYSNYVPGSFNIINNGLPSEENGPPALDYQHRGASAGQRPGTYAPFQPRAISGQTFQAAERQPTYNEQTLLQHSPYFGYGSYSGSHQSQSSVGPQQDFGPPGTSQDSARVDTSMHYHPYSSAYTSPPYRPDLQPLTSPASPHNAPSFHHPQLVSDPVNVTPSSSRQNAEYHQADAPEPMLDDAEFLAEMHAELSSLGQEIRLPQQQPVTTFSPSHQATPVSHLVPTTSGILSSASSVPTPSVPYKASVAHPDQVLPPSLDVFAGPAPPGDHLTPPEGQVRTRKRDWFKQAFGIVDKGAASSSAPAATATQSVSDTASPAEPGQPPQLFPLALSESPRALRPRTPQLSSDTAVDTPQSRNQTSIWNSLDVQRLTDTSELKPSSSFPVEGRAAPPVPLSTSFSDPGEEALDLTAEELQNFFDSLSPERLQRLSEIRMQLGLSTPAEAAIARYPVHVSPQTTLVGWDNDPHSRGQKKAQFDRPIVERDGEDPERSEEPKAEPAEVTLDYDESPIDWDFKLEDREANNMVVGPYGPDPDSELLETLSLILLDHQEREKLFNRKPDDAQVLIDYLYSILLKEKLPKSWLRRYCLVALYKLCTASQLYPRCYTLKETVVVSGDHEAFGGFSGIRKGIFEEKEICLKVLRLGGSDMNTMLKRYAKETILWGQLNHPNIAPFYGIYYLDGSRDRLCLASPWMKHGNLGEYLSRKQTVDRPRLAFDVVSGLGYIHDLGLIHGDLKRTNVLINDAEQACIADLGVSSVYTSETAPRPMAVATTTTDEATEGWVSPELLRANARPSMESDVWALGCVCYEILTGNPLNHSRVDKALKRPSSVRDKKEKAIWKQIERCLNRKPSKRPSCREILSKLKAAGITPNNLLEDHDAGREVLRFRNAMRRDNEDYVNVDEVKRILNGLSSSDGPRMLRRPLPKETKEKHERSLDVFSFFRFLWRLIRRV